MKPEARFWQAIRTHLPRKLDRLDRVENSATSGQPDVNGCLDSEDVWIELKAPKEPARASTPIMTRSGNHPLLESQISWFCRQRQAGGIAFILIRTNKRIMLVDGTKFATVFNTWTVGQMAEHSLLVCAVPTPKAEWDFLHHVIITASRHHRLYRNAQAQQLLDDMVKGSRLAGDPKPGGSDGALPGRIAAGRSSGRARSPRR